MRTPPPVPIERLASHSRTPTCHIVSACRIELLPQLFGPTKTTGPASSANSASFSSLKLRMRTLVIIPQFRPAAAFPESPQSPSYRWASITHSSPLFTSPFLASFFGRQGRISVLVGALVGGSRPLAPACACLHAVQAVRAHRAAPLTLCRVRTRSLPPPPLAKRIQFAAAYRSKTNPAASPFGCLLFSCGSRSPACRGCVLRTHGRRTWSGSARHTARQHPEAERKLDSIRRVAATAASSLSLPPLLLI